MKILEAKEEIIDVGPREPPSLKVEKTPSLGSEENAEAKNVLANGVAVLNGGGANGEKDRHRGIEDIGGGKRKSSAASSSACGTQGTYVRSKIDLASQRILHFSQKSCESRSRLFILDSPQILKIG